jgi:plastocyanin
VSRVLKYSLVATAAAFAALFAVLPATPTGRKVEMVRADGFRFRPTTVRIALDGAVTFTNNSRVTHTATCTGCPRDFDTGDVFPGASRTVRFARAGVYRFACRYHGARGMAAVLVVGSAPGPAAGPSP